MPWVRSSRTHPRLFSYTLHCLIALSIPHTTNPLSLPIFAISNSTHCPKTTDKTVPTALNPAHFQNIIDQCQQMIAGSQDLGQIPLNTFHALVSYPT